MYCCPICQESLEVESIAAVKCGHTFHLRCIRRWIKTSSTCPSCRFNITDFKTEVFSRLYFQSATLSNVSEALDNSNCKSELHKGIVGKFNTVRAELSKMKSDLSESENVLNGALMELEKANVEISRLGRKNDELEKSVKTLRDKRPAVLQTIGKGKDAVITIDENGIVINGVVMTNFV